MIEPQQQQQQQKRHNNMNLKETLKEIDFSYELDDFIITYKDRISKVQKEFDSEILETLYGGEQSDKVEDIRLEYFNKNSAEEIEAFYTLIECLEKQKVNFDEEKLKEDFLDSLDEPEELHQFQDDFEKDHFISFYDEKTDCYFEFPSKLENEKFLLNLLEELENEN